MRVLFINKLSSVYKSNIPFKSVVGANLNSERPQKPEHDNNSKMRNIIYWTIIANTLVASPLAKKYNDYKIDKEIQKQEIKAPKHDDLKELIENPKYSKAFYQLANLRDIEKPDVQQMNPNQYLIKLNLEGKSFKISMNTKDLEENKISGECVITDKNKQGLPDVFDYTAFIHPDDKRKVEIQLLSQDDSIPAKKMLIREDDGACYMIEKGKAKLLNSDMQQRYTLVQELEKLRSSSNEDYDEFQKVNYLLAIICTVFHMMANSASSRKER
ncbi:MAG: hypothetical protein KHX03_01175 [Clostridium sp.]|nr:hypothetical protein [Clostridium sp.]